MSRYRVRRLTSSCRASTGPVWGRRARRSRSISCSSRAEWLMPSAAHDAGRDLQRAQAQVAVIHVADQDQLVGLGVGLQLLQARAHLVRAADGGHGQEVADGAALLLAELGRIVLDGARQQSAPARDDAQHALVRSEEHTSELQSHLNLVCRLLLEKKKKDADKPIAEHY